MSDYGNLQDLQKTVQLMQKTQTASVNTVAEGLFCEAEF